MIFFTVVGRTFLGSYEVPAYEFEVIHMAIAVLLGVLAAVVMIVFVLVIALVKRACRLIPNRHALAIGGGAVVGLIALALPLTVGAGQSQLEVVIADGFSEDNTRDRIAAFQNAHPVKDVERFGQGINQPDHYKQQNDP